jgi:hypothetical protein
MAGSARTNWQRPLPGVGGSRTQLGGTCRRYVRPIVEALESRLAPAVTFTVDITDTIGATMTFIIPCCGKPNPARPRWGR